MKGRPTSILGVMLACLASAIIAGLLVASQCPRAETACHIAALQYLSSDPVQWTLWLHWANWLPGIIFGVLLSLALFPQGRIDWSRALKFSAASTVTYVVAGLVFAAFLSIAAADELALIIWVWPAGFVAGLTGAALLTFAAASLLSTKGLPALSLGRAWPPILAGAVLGLLFVLICIQGEQQIMLAWPLAFAAWQVGVGLLLRRASLSTSFTDNEVQ
jgi:hypothetical protein